jgi:outer membrane receptor protein involved in Fe transport
MTSRLYPLLVLTCAIPDAAAAQTAEPPADIVVLGRGLDTPPGAIAYGSVTIPRARLTSDASGRIEDVLQDVAGLQQFRRADSRSANPSAQGVTLRALGGNATSRALVLLDGVPQADPFFGYIPFNALVPDRLSAARITRGGGAGAFGAGALAGTIELDSATRADLPLVDGSAFYGSRHSEQVTASLSPDLGDGYVSASGRFERGDGFYTTPADQRGPADVRARYRDFSVAIRGVAPINADTELQVRTLIFRDNRTLRFRGADSSSDGQDASLRLIHRGAWAIDAIGYVQARNFTNKVISSTSYRLALDQRNTPSTGIGGKIELRPPVGTAHVVRLGIDARLAQGELYEDAYSTVTGRITATRHAGGDNATVGAFVEDDWTLGRLILTGGARVDRWTIHDGFFEQRDAGGALTTDTRYADRDGVAGTGRVGAVLTASPAVRLRAAGYTGFRVPTLNELYRPFTVFPIVTRANADLRLERLRGAELGVDLTPLPGVALGVTAFANRLDDAVANVTLTPVLRQRQNVDAIAVRGIEATAHVSRGSVSLDASYAFNDAHVRASGIAAALDGKIPAQSPRHAASATLAYRGTSGLILSTTLRHVGRQYEDDLETNVLPPATTVDAVAELPVARRVSFVGRAENLFDETVVTRNSGGSIDLGTPRTLWIGIRLR